MENFRDREKIFNYFDKYSQNSKDEIDERKTRNPLLKTYVFETFNEDLSSKYKNQFSVQSLFQIKNLEVEQIDERLYKLIRDTEPIGYLEQINYRFTNLYTNISASSSDTLMKTFLKESPLLDSMWISGKMFDSLLNQTVDYHYSHRFTKLKFEYDYIFDKKEYTDEIIEHKASTISFVEELDNILHKINGVRKYLPLFYAISSLRLPSKTGAGGHDFYYNGKVTNRSTSFYDHRKQTIDTIEKYQYITEYIESVAWLGLEKVPSNIESSFYSFKACPITINFNVPIQPRVLENFVYTTFQKGSDPFKIIGDIKTAGENRFHIYGTDLHLWQNVFLDISCNQIIVYLPFGTCGNTVNRLITHIQKFICPNIEVYIGDESFNQILTNKNIEGDTL